MTLRKNTSGHDSGPPWRTSLSVCVIPYGPVNNAMQFSFSFGSKTEIAYKKNSTEPPGGHTDYPQYSSELGYYGYCQWYCHLASRMMRKRQEY